MIQPATEIILDKPAYRLAEIQKLFNVSRHTVYRWRKEGALRTRRKGNTVIATAQDVRNFIATWDDGVAA